MIRSGSLNGLFVLGRSVGFIGHFLDQKRLKQGRKFCHVLFERVGPHLPVC
jgi:citrate synthase